MKNKAVFLDRDGTINVDKRYPHKIEDLEIIPGAIEGLKILQKSGYSLIIVTNQSGIGRGRYTEQDYFDFRDCLHRTLLKEGIEITAEYFCPHPPNEDCNCRKPKTGMLEKAAKDFALDLSECWMIGDRYTDILAGKKAGCRTIFVLTGKEYSGPIREADHIACDLFEAGLYI